jgi:purine-binding chemotaxis protein CheW
MSVTEQLAAESTVAEVPLGGASGPAVLLVRAGSHVCALPLDHVVETMRPLAIEPVAGGPSFVRGLSRIRGAPVPVVDLRSILGTDVNARGDAEVRRFVTLRVGGRRVALAVEAVVGVLRLEQARLRDMPPLLREAVGGAVEAAGTLDGELLLVLRAGRLVPEGLLQDVDATEATACP